MNKTKMIQVAVTQEQWEEIKTKADNNNIKIPEYIRLLCKGVKLK